MIYILYFLFHSIVFADFFDYSKFQNISNEVDSLLILHVSNESKDASVIFSKKSTETIYPASITKLMTCYAILNLLKDYRYLDELISIEKFHSRENILQNTNKITIKNLMLLMIMKSSNDSALILASEFGGGEVSEFVKLMNENAKECGMLKTNFVNPIGFFHKDHYSTLEDIAKLSIRLKEDFPEFMKIFNQSLLLKDGDILEKTTSIDFENENIIGSKTGFISKSNYNLMFWLQSSDGYFLVIFTGALSKEERDEIGREVAINLQKLDVGKQRSDSAEKAFFVNKFNSYIKHYVENYKAIDIKNTNILNRSIEGNKRFFRK